MEIRLHCQTKSSQSLNRFESSNSLNVLVNVKFVDCQHFESCKIELLMTVRQTTGLANERELLPPSADYTVWSEQFGPVSVFLLVLQYSNFV